MDLQTFQRYNVLVRRRMVKPLTCPTCESEYILRAADNANPVLQCFPCGAMVQPGINMWNDVRSVVKEHFENI